jgi:hypothetical protein
MAKITKNSLVRGARGNFGKEFVYKKRGKNTYITSMPTFENRKMTAEQEKVTDKFGSASLYAKGALADPELKLQYQKKATKGLTAHNIALRDYLRSPVVKSIDTSKYDGMPDSIIEVKAKDDFRVTEVTVSIRDSNGTVIEKGQAALNAIDLSKWTYKATEKNSPLTGSVVTATAVDLPGNKASLDVML